ncbi:MAG: hypothetical protein AAFY71_22105 [Bacteroidota bacterium]
MKNTFLFFSLLLFVLFSGIRSHAQWTDESNVLLSDRSLSLIFTSDGLLHIEIGTFPVDRDTLCDRDHHVIRSNGIRVFNNNWTRTNSFRYEKKDSILLLKAIYQAKRTFQLPYKITEHGSWLLDFREAKEIFPHLPAFHCQDSSLIEYLPLSSLQESSWSSINFENIFFLESNGRYVFKGYGGINKEGILDQVQFDQLRGLVRFIPMSHQVINFHRHIDGHSSYMSMEHDKGTFVAKGSLAEQPLLLKKLQLYAGEIMDSLSLSIIKTDEGWFNTDSSRCLIWYKEGIIPVKLVPRSAVQWGGKIQHRIHVLAKDRVIMGISYDYVLYVDEAKPGTRWSTADGLHPISSDKRLRKKTLKKIERRLMGKDE